VMVNAAMVARETHGDLKFPLNEELTPSRKRPMVFSPDDRFEAKIGWN
jgi:hypothetical protein